MPIDPKTVAIYGTTQEHLPIEDVSNGIVMLKDGSCSMVMQLSSVNFDLLSEREQQSLVFAYGGILNSFNFPVQIVIHTSTKDITVYKNNLKMAEEKQTNPLLRDRIKSYRAFVEELVRKNDVLSKSFYVIVPFSSLELGIKGGGAAIKNDLFALKKGQSSEAKLPYPKEQIFEKARLSLEPKRDQIIRLFSRLGLEVRTLGTKELVALFFKIYNEDSFTTQKISNDFGSPVVQSKLTPQV